ncbi:hypothetical protein OpiT1DRAFT_01402 [Opitutaceae bacterium TAV1]|nr:hypothetical protein OpiT1DRAFT_01402 [Opitutaceae bacterium TAV1]
MNTNSLPRHAGPLRRALLSLGAPGALGLALLAFAAPPARATVLTGNAGGFGYSSSLDGPGTHALVGAPNVATWDGAAYYYDLSTATPGDTLTVANAVKLTHTAADTQFGTSVSLDSTGTLALVGADAETIGGTKNVGAAYYYDLGTATAGQTLTTANAVRLTGDSTKYNTRFGTSTSLDSTGTHAIVGAYGESSDKGAAYYYDLSTATAGQTLTAANAVKFTGPTTSSNRFGTSVSLDSTGTHALVGALYDTVGGTNNVGAAYYYDLSTATPGDTLTVANAVKLTGTTSTNSYFGQFVSLDSTGTHALVGAHGGAGSAYYYDLSTATAGQTLTADNAVKLTGTTTSSDDFGGSVSLSGTHALVGAYGEDNYAGSAYYYDLSTATAGQTLTADNAVRLRSSTFSSKNSFGRTVNLSGTRFLIGAVYNAAGDGTNKAYAGDIRTYLTMDVGGAAQWGTDGLSFVTPYDWIIGQSTSGNLMTLNRLSSSYPDRAKVRGAGKAVYIGQEAGADGNSLVIDGELDANAVYVGAAGNTNNALALMVGGNTATTTGTVTADTLTVAAGNNIAFELGKGNTTATSSVNGRVTATTITLGAGSTLYIAIGDGFTPVTNAQYQLFRNFTTFTGTFADIEINDGGAADNLGLVWDTSLLYTQGIVRLIPPPPPTIDSFAATGSPATPTAAIDANPKEGNGTLVTTVEWSTTDAATVEVSGLYLSSTAPGGSETVTLPTGLHTFRVIARPGPVTLGWATTNADTLTLITPTGTEINVTGQDSHTVTDAGTWTLRANNANGTVTSTATVTIPAAASMDVEVIVHPKATIPPKIDDPTVIVTPDPDEPGGIVIGGGIDVIDPDDPDESKVFDQAQIFLVTTTDLENGPWVVADAGTYTVDVTPEGDIFSVTVAPTADAARFWRVATCLEPVDASGNPQSGDTLLYSRVPFGEYKVTVPAGKLKLVAYQLDQTGTGSIALNKLIPSAPIGTTVTRWAGGNPEFVIMGRNGWGRIFDVALGEAVLVDNPSATPLTLAVAGTMPLSVTTALDTGTTAKGSALPVAGAITSFAVTPVIGDMITETAIGEKRMHVNGRNGWGGGVPAFQIGEGFLYDRSGAAAGWTQEITLTTDTPDLTIRK